MNRGTRPRRRAAALLAAATLIGVGFLAAYLGIRALYPKQYSGFVERCCEEFGVEPELVYAVIHTESGFDPNARSQVGAMGLMQIMPDTFLWLQRGLPPEQPMEPEELYDPEVNIRYGVYFLSRLKEQFGSETLAVAAYHAGQNRVSLWLEEQTIPWEGCTADDIPASTTAHYVRKVQSAKNIYVRLY